MSRGAAKAAPRCRHDDERELPVLEEPVVPLVEDPLRAPVLLPDVAEEPELPKCVVEPSLALVLL